MELGNELFFWCGELIFVRQRKKKSGVFSLRLGVVFLLFLVVISFFWVISRFLGYFFALCDLYFARSAKTLLS